MKTLLLKQILIILFIILLSACASTIPKEIREAPLENTPVAAVRTNIEEFTGAHVRWGGTIASVTIHTSETWVEVVARDLDNEGKPIHNDHSTGRFIAIIEGFLEPTVYKKGRNITIAGTVEKGIIRKIGEFDYNFPLVRVKSSKLWNVYRQYQYYRPNYRPNWYFDPWYSGYSYYNYNQHHYRHH